MLFLFRFDKNFIDAYTGLWADSNSQFIKSDYAFDKGKNLILWIIAVKFVKQFDQVYGLKVT